MVADGGGLGAIGAGPWRQSLQLVSLLLLVVAGEVLLTLARAEELLLSLLVLAIRGLLSVLLQVSFNIILVLFNFSLFFTYKIDIELQF